MKTTDKTVKNVKNVEVHTEKNHLQTLEQQLPTDTDTDRFSDNLEVGGTTTTDNEDLADRLRKILQLQKKLSAEDQLEGGEPTSGSTLEMHKNEKIANKSNSALF